MQGRIPEAFWYCFPVVWQETCVSRRQSSAEDLKSILQLTSSPLAVLPGCIACTRTQKEPLSATAPFCSSLRVISPCVGNSRETHLSVQYHKLDSFHPRQDHTKSLNLDFSPSRGETREQPLWPSGVLGAIFTSAHRTSVSSFHF